MTYVQGDPRQVDLEELIAAKGGKPYTPPPPVRKVEKDIEAIFTTSRTLYAPLQRVLNEAFAQAAFGKGRDRHANDKPFDQQPIMEITRAHGIGFATGQAAKKGQEAVGMLMRGQHQAAAQELLGAIVYLAAAHIAILEVQGSEVDGKDQAR